MKFLADMGIQQFATLTNGAVCSVTERKIRIRTLPI